MVDVWANSMTCHPSATYHIAGCCHLANSLSRFQKSHMPHYRVQSSGEINVTIVPYCRVWEFHPPYWKSHSPYFIILFQCSLGFDERRFSYRLRYTCYSYYYSLPIVYGRPYCNDAKEGVGGITPPKLNRGDETLTRLGLQPRGYILGRLRSFSQLAEMPGMCLWLLSF